MKRVPFPVLALLAAFVAATTAASSSADVFANSNGDPSADGVLKIVEPRYRGLTDGESVVIDVLISADGTVEDTRAIVPASIPFVTSWIEEAVRQWCFEPSASDPGRRRRITFTLNSVQTDSPRGVRSRYESPLTLHVEYVVPTLWFIERVDGQIPTKSCEVHGEPMTVERLPIRYGLWGYSEERAKSLKKYWKARKRKFPYAHRYRRMGDIRGSEIEAETYVCSYCLEARKSWISQHPDVETEPY